MRLLPSVLRNCQDPCADAVDWFCEGVRLGHRRKMPRAPAIYREKDRWRIKYVDHSTAAKSWAPNYKTARERLEVIEAKISEDIAEGRMIRTSYAEAKTKYGENLLVEEGQEKFRLIHDGTHKVLINNRIRARDKLPSPIVYDIAAEMAATVFVGFLARSAVLDGIGVHVVPDIVDGGEKHAGSGIIGCHVEEVQREQRDQQDDG